MANKTLTATCEELKQQNVYMGNDCVKHRGTQIIIIIKKKTGLVNS